jgi:hypothetical protein
MGSRFRHQFIVHRAADSAIRNEMAAPPASGRHLRTFEFAEKHASTGPFNWLNLKILPGPVADSTTAAPFAAGQVKTAAGR